MSYAYVVCMTCGEGRQYTGQETTAPCKCHFLHCTSCDHWRSYKTAEAALAAPLCPCQALKDLERKKAEEFVKGLLNTPVPFIIEDWGGSLKFNPPPKRPTIPVFLPSIPGNHGDVWLAPLAYAYGNPPAVGEEWKLRVVDDDWNGETLRCFFERMMNAANCGKWPYEEAETQDGIKTEFVLTQISPYEFECWGAQNDIATFDITVRIVPLGTKALADLQSLKERVASLTETHQDSIRLVHRPQLSTGNLPRPIGAWKPATQERVSFGIGFAENTSE